MRRSFVRIPSHSMHELWPSVCGPCASTVWQHSERKCCKPQYGGFVRVTRWVRAGQLCSKSATSPPKLLLLACDGTLASHLVFGMWRSSWPSVAYPYTTPRFGVGRRPLPRKCSRLRGQLKPKGSTWHMDETLCASPEVPVPRRRQQRADGGLLLIRNSRS